MSRTRIVWTAGLLALLASMPPASAKEFWRQWDGGLPEEQGWTYNNWGDEAKRWLEGGTLVIDSRPPNGRYASHRIEYPNGGLNLQLGETFVLRWRLNILDMASYVDLSVGFISDDLYGIGLEFGKGYVYRYGENLGNFTLGQFHEFEVRTRDMRTFALAIDGQVTANGEFLDYVGPPRVWWGDGVSAFSLSKWDYFGYGIVHDAVAVGCFSGDTQGTVVPEPGVPNLAILLAAASLCRREYRRMKDCD